MSTVRVPDHDVVKILRHVEGQRIVYRTRAVSLGECTTRVVLGAKIHPRYAETVRSIVCAGRGSSAGLPEDIALTLEGYRVAARLPRALRTGIAIAPRASTRPDLPPDGEHWAARNLDPEDPEVHFSGLRWTQLPTEARWDWRTEAVDAGVTEEGHVYICTRYVEGEPISGLSPQVRDASGTTIAWNVALILAELHAHNVVYGDLKAANLVLTRTGRIVLIDLDTLREVGGPAIPSRTRDATRNWAAPEQLDRQETYLASDIYSYARLIESLWPDGVPSEINRVRRACRMVDPLRRPNTRSLLARMSGIWLAENDARARYGFVEELGDQPLLDWMERETPSGDEPPTGPVPDTDGPFSTDRVPDGAPATDTDRLQTGRLATERVGTERVDEAAAPLMASPPPTTLSTVPKAKRGCAPQVFGWMVAATLGFGVASACALFAWRLFDEHTANHTADALVLRLKAHKTDVAKNTDAEIQAIRGEAEDAWELAHTPRACAVRALTTVWEEGWHRDKPWNAARYEETRRVTLEPLCGMEPEAMLARATLSTAACINRDGTVPSFSECDAALASLDGLQSRVPDDADWHWLRVEALWQEVRTRRTLALRYAETGNAEQTPMFNAAVAACDAAVPILAYAPVNGPELFESCLPIAGALKDLDHYLSWSGALFTMPLPASSTARRYRLGHAYRDWGEECTEVSLKKRGGGWDVSGPPWCVALGHLARGCSADALKEVEARGGDADHDWLALTARAQANPTSTCVQ